MAIFDQVQAITKTGVWEFDPGTKQSTWSRQMYRIHGLPEDFPLEIEKLLAIYSPRDRQRVSESLAAMTKTGKPSRLELQVETPEGPRILRSLAFPQVENGLVSSIIGYVTDVTETRAAAEARKVLQERERELQRVQELERLRIDMLRSTAHELNTPLTPLRLALASLRGAQNLDEKQQHSLQLMERNLLRLSSLVQDMLDAARLQGGRLKIMREPCNLRSMVDEAVETFQDAARKAETTIHSEVPEALMVDVDRSKTLQVLFNLVSNAVKYAPKSNVTISAQKQGPQAILSITDTGLGLTPDQASRLFQPFVRVHDVASKVEGTGLGLYISKGIIELQGGSITVESAGPGQGSTFRVALPLVSSLVRGSS